MLRILLLSLLTMGCAHVEAGSSISPGIAAEGNWIPFHTREFPPERLDYFYDQSRVHRSGDRVIARWKVTGGPTARTTLYVIDIACREGTFTEKGTVMIDTEGRTQKLPQSKLLIDHLIETGTSSDKFRRIFCQ